MGLTAIISAPRLIVRVIQPIAVPLPRLCRASAAPDGSEVSLADCRFIPFIISVVPAPQPFRCGCPLRVLRSPLFV